MNNRFNGLVCAACIFVNDFNKYRSELFWKVVEWMMMELDAAYVWASWRWGFDLVWLNGSRFMIRDKVLNFHDWILCYHEPFHNMVKNQRKISTDFYLWNKIYLYIFIFKMYICILSFLSSINTFHVAYNQVLSNLKNLFLKFRKKMIITSLVYSH